MKWFKKIFKKKKQLDIRRDYIEIRDHYYRRGNENGYYKGDNKNEDT
jgi:hypothetical protein